GYTISASRRSELHSDRLAPTPSPNDGSGQPEPSVWISCSSSASAICDMCWLSTSPISTSGGRTDRLANARPVLRRELSKAKSVATSLRRRCSAGCITSTIWLHDHPDGDFEPYRVIPLCRRSQSDSCPAIQFQQICN